MPSTKSDVMERTKENISVAIKEFDKHNVPPYARTYIRDIQTQIEENHKYISAAESLSSLREMMEEDGVDEEEPLLTLLSETSTNLYWMSEQEA